MIIGARGSDLARIQAEIVARKISSKLGIEIKQISIRTSGDVLTDQPLYELEEKGFFTGEIEKALIDRRIDVAVHSLKDLPLKAPESLALTAITAREDPADLLIAHKSSFDPDAGKIPVKKDAIVGTSAIRRKTQLFTLRNDLTVDNLRGNVPTRIKKLGKKLYDAIFLASAGVRRLNLDLSEFEIARLDPTMFVPSPGQGALAVQMRKDDPKFEAIRKIIHNDKSEAATCIERNVLARFGGGCSLPLGVYAWIQSDTWHACGFWGGNAEKPVWSEVSSNSPESLDEKLFLALQK